MLTESSEYHYSVPISWRIDAIIDENDHFWINEINVPDGADALMIAEQQAYGLTPPFKLDTAEAYIRYVDSVNKSDNSHIVAIIAENLRRSPYTSNVIKMIKFIEAASRGKYSIDLIDRCEINDLINWGKYATIINNGGYITPRQLEEAGLNLEKLSSAGAYSAIGSKAVFAAFYDASSELHDKLSDVELMLLKKVIPYTAVLKTREELRSALGEQSWVVKAFFAPVNQINRLERSRAVVGPWSSDAERDKVVHLHDLGVKFIKQQYIKPRKFSTLLRSKGGRRLEPAERFNRICVKYVNIEHDGLQPVPTAVEATLGTKIVPTGRDTCFTPVSFVADEKPVA